MSEEWDKDYAYEPAICRATIVQIKPSYEILEQQLADSKAECDKLKADLEAEKFLFKTLEKGYYKNTEELDRLRALNNKGDV